MASKSTKFQGSNQFNAAQNLTTPRQRVGFHHWRHWPEHQFKRQRLIDCSGLIYQMARVEQ